MSVLTLRQFVENATLTLASFDKVTRDRSQYAPGCVSTTRLESEWWDALRKYQAGNVELKAEIARARSDGRTLPSPLAKRAVWW